MQFNILDVVHFLQALLFLDTLINKHYILKASFIHKKEILALFLLRVSSDAKNAHKYKGIRIKLGQET